MARTGVTAVLALIFAVTFGILGNQHAPKPVTSPPARVAAGRAPGAGMAVSARMLPNARRDATRRGLAATRRVVFGGYALSAPASWPVYRLGRGSTRCVRYDVNAVYLGTPGVNQDCPARVIGQADTISIESPAVAGPAGQSHALTQVRSGDEAPASGQQQGGLTISVTYGADRGEISRVLHSIREVGSAATVMIRPVRARAPARPGGGRVQPRGHAAGSAAPAQAGRVSGVAPAAVALPSPQPQPQPVAPVSPKRDRQPGQSRPDRDHAARHSGSRHSKATHRKARHRGARHSGRARRHSQDTTRHGNRRHGDRRDRRGKRSRHSDRAHKHPAGKPSRSPARPSKSPSPTRSAAPTRSPVQPLPTPTRSLTPTRPPSPTHTPTPSPTHRPTPTPTHTRTPTPSPTHTPTPTPTPSQSPSPSAKGVPGFDTCTAPSLNAMRAWRQAYSAVAIYIGGVEMGCGYGNLSASWVTAVKQMHWSLIPLYVGLQAPCDSFSNVISPGYAASQGAGAARAAVANAQYFGIGRRAPIYFDMEGYDDKDTSCKDAVLTFLSAWTQELHALGYQAGVYSSAGSGGQDLGNATTIGGQPVAKPDDMWFALWDGQANLAGTPYMQGSWWPDHKIKQYQGGHEVSVGGVSLDIDSDWVGGAVY